MEQLVSHWTDLYEILHLNVFRKSVEKIHVYLNLTKITGFLYEDQYIFFTISCSILLR